MPLRLRHHPQRLHLSEWAFHLVLQLVRTVTDLKGSESISAPHVAEALQYRARGEAG
jgi:magnesium chelatase family protein